MTTKMLTTELMQEVDDLDLDSRVTNLFSLVVDAIDELQNQINDLMDVGEVLDEYEFRYQAELTD